MKFSTIIGNAFGKAKQAVSAFFGKQKKNKYSSIARSIYLSAGAFLQGQKRPGHVTLTLTDRIITRSYGHTVIRSYGHTAYESYTSSHWVKRKRALVKNHFAAPIQ